MSSPSAGGKKYERTVLAVPAATAAAGVGFGVIVAAAATTVVVEGVELVVGGFAHVNEYDLEMQALAGQGVIEVGDDRFCFSFCFFGHDFSFQ